jgi:hypothetical protein
MGHTTESFRTRGSWPTCWPGIRYAAEQTAARRNPGS